MKNLTNYHSHCSYCDGKSHLEEFILAAISHGFTSYGISSHAPVPFPTHWAMKREDMDNYLRECNDLREKYTNQIELYVGLEIDYLTDSQCPSISYFQALPLDYRIGSVHLIYDDNGVVVDLDVNTIRFAENIHTYFSGDIEFVVRRYYASLMRMIELGGFDFLGHPDKISLNASSFRQGITSESWYKQLIDDYFHYIAEKKIRVELNTKAYGHSGMFFPNEENLHYLKSLSIPVVVNSDAHYPDKVNENRDLALQALLRNGIATVSELHGGKWIEVPISE